MVTEVIFSPVMEFDRGAFECIGYDLKGQQVGTVGKLKLKIRGKSFHLVLHRIKVSIYG